MSNSIVTTSTIKNSKGIKPLTMITAYDYAFAKIFDQAGIDMILVGDSLGNVILGYSSTLPVTMEDMIHHTKAVTRACSRTLVVADMPFMSYQVSTEQALINAGRLVKEAGAHAVKLEGGAEITATIEKLVQSGIPVIGHLGLTPQSVNQLGGFKVQGKTLSAAQKILQDAQALATAGVFALVLECIPHQLALKITESVNIPTIGIGAGNNCDGQVLVCNDLLGLNTEFTPKFVKKYRNLQQEIFTATQEYINDVQTRTFPATEHTFSMQDEVLEKLY
ncbi:3-methyl-2-oxobutanoate hydroxymethyltransferase [Succinispira mobilis]|uniref:3-methyl-2-oxobutanoate hydroxymethyltransferase n=1 Tax=Succinispira mobilis TaxID=78120 RepID=UPI00037FDE97|nr:3-methyl-2-oxobutanoate hydroxymethyltransferase [Succinispira mobilis]